MATSTSTTKAAKPVSPYTTEGTPTAAESRAAVLSWAQWDLRDEGTLYWNDITGEVIWTTEDTIYRLKPGATPPVAPSKAT